MARVRRAQLQNAERQLRFFESVLLPLAKQMTTLKLLQHNAMQIGAIPLLHAKIFELEQQIKHIGLEKDYWLAAAEYERLKNGHLRRGHG